VTRNDLAPPIEAGREATHTAVDTTLILRLASTVEQLTAALTAADQELRCYTPKEAAAILGKTENWVVEAIQGRRIPFTYVGKSPRLTAEHIRWIRAQGEVLPSKYATRAAA
jgi:hypothetical protein